MLDSSEPPAASPLRVVMIPDYRATNPYQRLIAEGLEKLGARINFSSSGGRRLFPLRSAAKRFDVDLVHLHWITPFLRDLPAPLYALYVVRLLLDIALTRSAGVSVVWTIHNKVSHDTRHPRFELFVRRCIARMVDAMIVHSPEIRREIAAIYRRPAARFDVVPHASFGDLYGARVEEWEARDTLAVSRAGRVFLNLGLMRPYKGLKRLLEAWSASGLGNAGHTLILAGDFNDPAFRDEIVNGAAALAGVRVDVGHVPNDRVRLYFGACDAVVLPFEKILTSSSMHLAITFGKPIVAPRVGSVVEMLPKAGRYLYDPADPNALRDALLRCALADDAELAAEREESERVRTTLLDWNGVARATLAVYERVRLGHPRDHRDDRAAARPIAGARRR